MVTAAPYQTSCFVSSKLKLAWDERLLLLSVQSPNL
jgi:hypothetical protein